MEEKIELLKTHLIIFGRKQNYVLVLSLGIHELDEETCLVHFDTFKSRDRNHSDEKIRWI